MKKPCGTLFRNAGIGTKFIISLFLVMILPLAGLLLWVNSSVTRQLEAQSCRTILATLKQAQVPLNTMISDVNYVSKDILGDDRVQNYLKQCASNCTREELFKVQYPTDLYLAQLLDSRSYIQSAALFDPSGSVRLRSGAYQPDDALPSDLESLGLGERALCWYGTKTNDAYVSRYDRGRELIVLRAIRDMQSFTTVLGIEKLTVREEYVCSLYSGTAESETDNIFLADTSGGVISSMDKTLFDGDGARALVERIRASGQRDGFFFDGRQVVSYCTIDGPGWLLVRVDAPAAVNRWGLLNGIIYFSMLLTVVFGVLFYLMQQRTIIRPVRSLSLEAQNFRDGSMHIRRVATGGDEIGQLSRSMAEMGDYIRDLVDRVYKSQLAEKETQLRYLQSQIDPHFLYNTLESIRWMAIRNHQYDIAQQTEALSRLFKHALNDGRQMTTVREELDHLHDYVTIQANRFGDRIEVLVSADDDTLGCPVPNLVLQPLVENSIVHGLQDKLGHGVVEVKVRHDGDVLRYTVEDNGLGADEAAVCRALEQDSPNALALCNIQKRLRCRYGPQYGLQFESRPGGGARVTVRMPFCPGNEVSDETADRG